MDGLLGGTKIKKNIAEKFNSLPRVRQRYRRQTDRQTTDGRLMPQGSNVRLKITINKL